MEQYKQEFIEFMIDCNVLKFGDFTNEERKKDSVFCKHRILPYRCSASASWASIMQKRSMSKFGLDFDVLFGPAYKGIPLSVAATMAISETVRQRYPLLLQP